MPPSELLPNSRPASLDELCEKAMNLQVAGRLDLAEPIYREILQAQPLHAAANYCFGILLVHVKRPGDGLLHLLAALAQSPQVPDY
jgi:Tfp pilus assembly protein PilF